MTLKSKLGRDGEFVYNYHDPRINLATKVVRLIQVGSASFFRNLRGRGYEPLHDRFNTYELPRFDSEVDVVRQMLQMD